MTHSVLVAVFLACSIVSLALGAPSASAPASPGVHLLFQNDLDWTSTNNHPSYLLIDTAQSYNDASKACQRLSEQLIKPPTSSSSAGSDLRKQLRYLVSTDVLSSSGQAVWVDQGAIQVSKDGSWSTQKSKSKTQRLPVLTPTLLFARRPMRAILPHAGRSKSAAKTRSPHIQDTAMR